MHSLRPVLLCLGANSNIYMATIIQTVKLFSITHNMWLEYDNMDYCVWMTRINRASVCTAIMCDVTAYNLCLSKVICSFS